MKKAAFGALWALVVVAIFGVSIGAIYAVVLPKFFPGPGWGTGSPLIGGISIATLIGGYIGYRVPATGKLPVKISAEGVDAAGVSVGYWQSLHDFWKTYFAQAGATLAGYSALRDLPEFERSSPTTADGRGR